MNDNTLQVILRLYPRDWRARYGDELASVIHESSGPRSPSIRLLTNVAFAGVRERLRAIGLLGNDLTPRDRVQSGALLVMWSWMFFVLGGIGVQKAAEHWKAAVPAASVRLPDVAFASLIAAAAIGSLLVIVGVLIYSKTLASFLRTGGWYQIRRPIYRASAITGLTMIGLLTLSTWAHHLTVAQRNGHSLAYGAAVLGWAVLFAGCLFGWALAAATTIRQLNPKQRLLKLEACIVAAVTVAMAVMTVTSAVWWVSVAHSAPWFFAGTAPDSPGTIAPLNLVIPIALMLTATLLASLGARRSIRNAPHVA
jgi:hypothetical protein